MYILKNTSRRGSVTDRTMKDFDRSIIGPNNYEVAQGSPILQKPVNVRKLPTSGPFSIAHNKLRNLL
jgi:hypothetical protein